MKVFVTAELSSNNPYMSLLATALTEQGVDIQVPSISRLFLLNAVRQYGKPDIIHIQWHHEYLVSVKDVFYLRTIGRTLFFYLQIILLRLIGVNFVWTIHNIVNHERVKEKWELYNCRILARLVDRLIVHCSEAVTTVATAYRVDPKKINIVPLGDYGEWYSSSETQAEARQKLGIHLDQKILLFFGMIRGYKGLDRLLDAFTEISCDSTQLYIIGRPGNSHIAQEIEGKAKLDPRISLHLTFMDDDLLVRHIVACDFVVLPYLDLLTSSATNLAATMGKPLIIPKINCMKQFPEDAALFFDSTDPNDLQRVLRHAVELSATEKILRGENARKYIQQFKWASVAEKTKAIYESCVHT